MKKKGFTLIELLISFIIIAIGCSIAATMFVSSSLQSRRADECNESLSASAYILDCLKLSGGDKVGSIYELSPKGPDGYASWCISFNSKSEINALIQEMKSFPEYKEFEDVQKNVLGLRYTAYILIAKRTDDFQGFSVYPVKIMLKDHASSISVWTQMDYEFISGA